MNITSFHLALSKLWKMSRKEHLALNIKPNKWPFQLLFNGCIFETTASIYFLSATIKGYVHLLSIAVLCIGECSLSLSLSSQNLLNFTFNLHAKADSSIHVKKFFLQKYSKDTEYHKIRQFLFPTGCEIQSETPKSVYYIPHTDYKENVYRTHAHRLWRPVCTTKRYQAAITLT